MWRTYKHISTRNYEFSDFMKAVVFLEKTAALSFRALYLSQMQGRRHVVKVELKTETDAAKLQKIQNRIDDIFSEL
jgi:pterin-4a-carbinolamine dehydratase